MLKLSHVYVPDQRVVYYTDWQWLVPKLALYRFGALEGHAEA